jgi:N-acetylmuramoyl-L-alanine amidase
VPEALTAVKESVQQTFLPRTPRVGLQIGHLNPEEQPDELASLRINTGGYAFGLNEVDINKATAYMLKDMLEFEGIEVDILPATIPPNYHADLVIALHSDSSPDVTRRGYKSAHFRYPRNKWEDELKAVIDQSYFFFSGLPDDDDNVSGSMLEYYAFNRARYKHAVSRSTPAVIVEMGYISNEKDRAFLIDPVNPAYALKRGILTYLAERGRYTPKE